MTSKQESDKETIGVTPQVIAPEEDDSVKEPSNRRLFVSLVIVALFILLSLAFWHWWDNLKLLIDFVSDQEQFGEYLRSFGVLAPLVLFAAQMIQVFIAFIPGHVVSISGGYVFGFAWGLIMNIAFTVFASQMAYYLARYAGRPIVYKLADRETVDYWERVANQKGTVFFTIAFLLPIFPSDAMNFVGGLSGISAGKFFIANLFGRTPSAIMLTMIGAYGMEFSNLAWGVIILIFVLVFFAGNYGARWIKNSIDQIDPADADLLGEEHRSGELAEVSGDVAEQEA
ncbi:MAG: TVP38/TMEM64 family protein [Candidatus Promineifilaceae bacterium]